MKNHICENCANHSAFNAPQELNGKTPVAEALDCLHGSIDLLRQRIDALHNKIGPALKPPQMVAGGGAENPAQTDSNSDLVCAINADTKRIEGLINDVEILIYRVEL